MSFDLETLSARPRTLTIEEARPLAGEVEALLRRWGSRAEVRSHPPPGLATGRRRAEDAGLTWHVNYPAVHLGERERIEVLEALQASLSTHTEIFSATTVTGLERVPWGWQINATRAAGTMAIQSAAVLFAPGRGGAEWMASVLENVGVEVQRSVSVGVRVETRSEVLAPLTDLTPDPRLSMGMDMGSFRTYAFGVGGKVCTVTDGGPIRISCRPAPRAADVKRSDNTSFAILWEPGDRRKQELCMRRAPPALMAHLDTGCAPEGLRSPAWSPRSTCRRVTSRPTGRTSIGAGSVTSFAA